MYYDVMKWLEDIHSDYYGVEVSSLLCPHRDRECFGKVISIDNDYVIIETDEGERIKWTNGKLLRLPEIIL